VESELRGIRTAIVARDAEAAERLLPLVYEELRRTARRHLRREAAGQSLYTTELVHEAYLRLMAPAGQDEARWDGQAHYLSACARAMRRILVDGARARGSIKRGGGQRRLDLLDVALLSAEEVPLEVLDLDDALLRLAEEAPEQAELVSLRFFSGLTLKEAAAVLGISPATADRHWAFARAWLLTAMDGGV